MVLVPLKRRWFIRNAAFQKDHPWADKPVDGYYPTEEIAKVAKAIIVDSVGPKIDPAIFVIEFEDVPLSADDLEDGECDPRDLLRR